MNKATILSKMPSIDNTSEEIYDNIRPPVSGVFINYDELIGSSLEDQFIQMIGDLPNEDQIEILMSRLRAPQLKYIERVLGTWVCAAEKLLGRDNTRVGERFVELANRWHDETDYLSSPSSITNNDTYLKIISMGESVIPLILQDLQERGGDWYRALRILSDVDPVSPEVRGDVPKMKEAWLSWGRDKRYIK